MRLAEFILANTEPILAEWEVFARSIWPGGPANALVLRDHAHDILIATAQDMKSAQDPAEQADKSRGEGADGRASRRVDGASDVHARTRVASGFDLLAVVAEYRALRASVIRLWRESTPAPDDRDLADLTRFNESIDQSLTEAIRSYTISIDRSRQMFLAILGHDLRSPLNSINLLARLLGQNAGADTESAEMAAQIGASVTAMGAMIGDLLDFTSTGLGAQIPVATAAMDLRLLCEEVIAEIGAGDPALKVRFEPSGDLTGSWDPARLRQVVSNLLGNAIQHGAEGHPVELSATGNASEVVLAVRNGGPPIPADLLPTIFDPLVRAPSAGTVKPRRRGSIGLGLYIAREVVTAHGGTIGVTSSENAGTVFKVRLPRQPPPGSGADGRPAGGAAQPARRIG